MSFRPAIETWEDVRFLAAQGFSENDIAEKLGVSTDYIRYVLPRRMQGVTAETVRNRRIARRTAWETRTVHAIMIDDGSEIVHYRYGDEKGKRPEGHTAWYIEYPDGHRTRISMSAAAQYAVDGGMIYVTPSTSGSRRFDSLVRSLKGLS